MKRSEMLKLIKAGLEEFYEMKLTVDESAQLILNDLEKLGLLPDSIYYGSCGEYGKFSEGADTVFEECDMRIEWEPEEELDKLKK